MKAALEITAVASCLKGHVSEPSARGRIGRRTPSKLAQPRNRAGYPVERGPSPLASGGFSLIEVMISNLLCVALLIGWSQFVSILQSACQTQSDHHQIQLSARVAHRTLNTSVQQAGQNRTRGYLVSSRTEELAVDSDLNGEAGDPDNALNHPFEAQHFRMNPDFVATMTGADFDRNGNMQWKSGSGSFQPWVSRITAAGFEVEQGEFPRFVVTRLQARGRLGNRSGKPTRSFEVVSPVEKNREQWFRYDLP